jgi:hypothetical protein
MAALGKFSFLRFPRIKEKNLGIIISRTDPWVRLQISKGKVYSSRRRALLRLFADRPTVDAASSRERHPLSNIALVFFKYI